MIRQRKPAQPAEQTALFGSSAPVGTLDDKRPERAQIQDLDAVAAVVKAADDPGFLVIERSGRVVKLDPARPGVVDSVARHEQDTVNQLLDAGHLRLGGSHHVHHHGYEGAARAVLVPKATRDMVTRWSNLLPIPAPATETRSSGKAGQRRSGPIGVDIVEAGKALVTSADFSGTIIRNRYPEYSAGRYLVETEHGQVIGHVSSYRAGAGMLARHHGYRPGPVEIEHEYRLT